MPPIEKLGRYEIRRELGRGAMGVVYEAYDPMIKRVVALKTIRADQLDSAEAPVIIARFRREAEAAGRLNHPNIVSIYDFGEEAGVSYIAMEYVKGRELKDYFQSNERFTNADVVVLTDIYPSGTVPIPGVSGKLIVNAVTEAHPELRVVWLPRRDDLVTFLSAEVRAGDVCISMGCGDIATLPGEVLDARRR